MSNNIVVSDWLKEPVTVDFFKRVEALIVDNDEKVHEALSKGQLEQASLYNAGIDQLREVVDIPEQIKLEDNEDE